MRIVPDLAESWTVADDARTFDFILREDVRMHDGSFLDAGLVAWNFARVADSRTGSVLASDYDGLESVTPVSKEHVRFNFAEPFPAFLYHLAGRSYLTADTASQPTGAGPFRLTEWHRGSHLVLERFDRYFLPERPTIQGAIVKWAPTAEARIEAMSSGSADIVESVPASAAKVDFGGQFVIHRSRGLRRTSLVFNCKTAPFDDVRVRRACALVVDRRALAFAVAGEFATPIIGTYPETDPDWAVNIPQRKHDVRAARTLMNEAGYANGFAVRGAATNVAPMPRVVEHVCAALSTIGITVDVQHYDDPPWWPLIYLKGDWQIAFQGMGARPHPDVLLRREFKSDGPFNPTGHLNPVLDRTIVRAAHECNVAKQKSLYQQAQTIIEEDVPTLPLYCSDSVLAASASLSGVNAHSLGYIDLTEVVRC